MVRLQHAERLGGSPVVLPRCFIVTLNLLMLVLVLIANVVMLVRKSGKLVVSHFYLAVAPNRGYNRKKSFPTKTRKCDPEGPWFVVMNRDHI